MSIKQVIVSTTAAVTIALSGALFAETAAQQAPSNAEQYLHRCR